MRGSRVLIALLFSIFAAQSASAASVWLYNIRVDKIQTIHTGDFIMYVPTGTGPTCPDNGSGFNFASGYNNQTPEGIKISLAAVMMAMAMGKLISFAYDDGPGCYVQSVVIIR